MKSIKLLFIISFFTIALLSCSVDNRTSKDSFADVSTIEISTVIEQKNLDKHPSILSEKEKTKVTLGVYHSVAGGLLFVADGLGYFSERNLDVQIRLYKDYKGLLEGFKKNEVDIATIGLYESMMLALDNVDFVGVAPLIWKQIYFMVNGNKYRQKFITKIKEDLQKKYGNRLDEDSFRLADTDKSIIKYTYSIKGVKKTNSINFYNYIKNIKNLKNKIIGLDTESVAYYILNNVLINEAGLVIDEINEIWIPDTQLQSDLSQGKIDVGAFSDFNKLDENSGGMVVFDSSNYKTHTVESLLIQRKFAMNHGDAVVRVIEGWKKAVVYFKKYKNDAIDIMRHRGRLNFSKGKLEKALEETPIIPIMNNPVDNAKLGHKVEYELKESYFNIAGNYSVEASQLLDFITKNYKKYNKIEYQNKAQEIRKKLEKDYYFNIIYLSTAGFKESSVSKPTNLNKNKWNENKIEIAPDYSEIDWDNIYPKNEFAPKAIKISIFENEIKPNLNLSGKYIINSSYKKRRYHYVKSENISNSEDERIIEVFKNMGYKLSNLESKTYDPFIEKHGRSYPVLADDNEGYWGFYY